MATLETSETSTSASARNVTTLRALLSKYSTFGSVSAWRFQAATSRGASLRRRGCPASTTRIVASVPRRAGTASSPTRWAALSSGLKVGAKSTRRPRSEPLSADGSGSLRNSPSICGYPVAHTRSSSSSASSRVSRACCSLLTQTRSQAAEE